MKQTDFAISLSKFMLDYQPNQRACSHNTMDSYRYAFIFLLDYFREIHKITANELCLKQFTYKNVLSYFHWLEDKRKCSISTRNQRQSAINSFVRYLTYEHPEYLHEYQRILGIPVKRQPQKEISYLKTEGVIELMKVVDTTKGNGLRDYVILMLLYATGIRVSELISIRIRDLSLHEPCTLLVHGKGGKSRFVPLVKDAVPIIQRYLERYKLTRPEVLEKNMFLNHMGRPFTRQGINHLVKKYAGLARENNPDLIPKDLSPHKMRHTAAMELVNSGVDLIYIRDLLGHVSVKTTEIYARADTVQKRKAIEAASKEIVPPEEARWDNNEDLKSWLKGFNK